MRDSERRQAVPEREEGVLAGRLKGQRKLVEAKRGLGGASQAAASDDASKEPCEEENERHAARKRWPSAEPDQEETNELEKHPTHDRAEAAPARVGEVRPKQRRQMDEHAIHAATNRGGHRGLHAEALHIEDVVDVQAVHGEADREVEDEERRQHAGPQCAGAEGGSDIPTIVTGRHANLAIFLGRHAVVAVTVRQRKLSTHLRSARGQILMGAKLPADFLRAKLPEC
eukprot:scaffold110780_cov63-Phaeocystis_antarctica.AAC.3